MGNLTPHFKTIANFRKENKKAIEQVFRRFSLICDELGLVGKEMVAVDDSEFRANNGRSAWYNKKEVANSLAYYRASALTVGFGNLSSLIGCFLPAFLLKPFLMLT